MTTACDIDIVEGGMMDGGMMGMMGGWMLLWTLVGIAVLVVSVLAAIWFIRDRSPSRLDASPTASRKGQVASAQELLRRRYAAGEIDREKYLRMQRDLSGE